MLLLAYILLSFAVSILKCIQLHVQLASRRARHGWNWLAACIPITTCRVQHLLFVAEHI